MDVTRVEFIEVNKKAREDSGIVFVATCDVVLDDCLRLKGITLCAKKSRADFYLIFPSKQDVYRSVKELNSGVDIVFPVNPKNRFFIDENKSYEEFYHPVSKVFYNKLLSVISDAFDACISKKGEVLKASYKV